MDDPVALVWAKVPEIAAWVDRLLAELEPSARSLAAYGFPRLHSFFPPDFLADIQVVETPVPPKPPLLEMGLGMFSDFAAMPVDAITYKNPIYVVPERARDETLQCHELIHIVQWQTLGEERFLLNYALGLMGYGYDDHPLEIMARDLEEDFRRACRTNHSPHRGRREVWIGGGFPDS